MAIRKRWSSTVGSKRGARVRVYERNPHGTLYCAVWIAGRGISRRSLGHTDKKRAMREAAELALLRASGEALTPKATLGALCERYLAECTHRNDGSLKTELYRRDCAARANRLVQWFGAHCKATALTPERFAEYSRARRAGKVSGRVVRTRSLQCDLKLLKGVFKWATGVYEAGKPLLERNPLAALSAPREVNPRRPLLEDSAVEALLSVADQVSPLLPALIVLMDSTGRRLSSVLGLRWDDVDLDKQRIRWRAELEKTRRASETPLPKAALPALQALRRAQPAIGSALLFPHPKRSMAGQPVTRHLASYWLQRTFRLAKVAKPDGTLWHAFRRRWATLRKHLPLKDVAAAGGWKDVTTLLTCYQQPDEDTLREVVDYQRPARRA